MKIFKEAYKIVKENAVMLDYKGKNSLNYIIKGKTDNYVFKIWLNVSSWLSQCGCRVGANHQPSALCKHFIAGLIKTFLIANNLKLVEVNT